MQPAPHAARPGTGGCGPGGQRRGQGELRGRRNPSATARLPASAAGRRARPRSPSRPAWSSARTASTRWWPAAVGARAYRTGATAVDRVLHLLGGRAVLGTAARPGPGEIYGRPGCAVGAWPTNDGLLMTYPFGSAAPVRRVPPRRRGQLPAYASTPWAWASGSGRAPGASASAAPPTCPATCASPTVPGWALVGDAGLLMDPVTGQGISHAFRDAELLADAVADGLGGIRPLAEALRGYHRARDRAARPMYDFTARGWPRSARPRLAESALFRRSRAASRTPTCSSARWLTGPAAPVHVTAHHGAPRRRGAGSPGWRSARPGRSGLGRTLRLSPASSSTAGRAAAD